MTTTWILTTGNSDIQLTTKDNWNDICRPFRNNQFQGLKFEPQEDDDQHFFLPARSVGLAYSENLEEYYTDLVFPLMDGFANKLKLEGITINRIILLLTNQEHIFEEDDQYEENCPYWQDTCTAKPIFEKYFQEHKLLKEAELISLTLTPKAGEKGLDSWDSALPLVQKTLNQVRFEKNEIVYVSHQAGTPAISSALQFVSLGQFDNRVKFLVGNEYNPDDIDILESSTYLRGIKVSQAKSFIVKGEPGVALQILNSLQYFEHEKSDKDLESHSQLEKYKESLENLINRFNIKDTKILQNPDEFDPKKAIERVVDALDLIEIFFKNENYALGVALLAAAHETFLKAAILERLNLLPSQTVNGIEVQPTSLIEWDNSGLYLKSKSLPNDDSKQYLIQEFGNLNFSKIEGKVEVSTLLKFPVPEDCDRDAYQKESSNDYQSFWGNHPNQSSYIYNGQNKPKFYLKDIHDTRYFAPNNSRMFKWLNKLRKFNSWPLLNWTCTYKRDREQDKRNQLMHNLRGVKKQDVIQYLQDPDGNFVLPSENVAEVYRKVVKQPFRDALRDLGLCDSDSIENELQKELEELADKLR